MRSFPSLSLHDVQGDPVYLTCDTIVKTVRVCVSPSLRVCGAAGATPVCG